MAGEYGNDFITLVDEDGEELEFEVIDTLEYNDSVYYALSEVQNDAQAALEDSAEVVILKAITAENGEDELVTIEDEEELDTVFNLFVEAQEEDEDELSEIDGGPVN